VSTKNRSPSLLRNNNLENLEWLPSVGQERAGCRENWSGAGRAVCSLRSVTISLVFLRAGRGGQGLAH